MFKLLFLSFFFYCDIKGYKLSEKMICRPFVTVITVSVVRAQ